MPTDSVHPDRPSDSVDSAACPGAAEYGHGLTRTVVHAGGCCDVPTALDFPDCRACQMWKDAGASWPRPCKQHYGGESCA